MKIRTMIEIENFKELEYLNGLCSNINIPTKDGCSKCVFYPRCINDDALWMYNEMIGPTPQVIKKKYDKESWEINENNESICD